jgi:cholesterol oxidase
MHAHPSGHRVLSDPLAGLAEHHEHVVIGSGYGASVAALRLAERGVAREGSLLVLERGREWLPGDFPEDLPALGAEVRTALQPLGLLDHQGDVRADVDVIGASGLGGTSLINAAIFLRPMANVWAQPEWPRALREDAARGLLEGDFARAEAMLRPTTGPHARSLARARAHRDMLRLEVPRGELSLAINHEEGRAAHGLRQRACVGCGNCCGGCNVGAKNTLTATYLPAAATLGARLVTQVEVTHLEKLPVVREGGARWLVHYVRHAHGPFGVRSTEGSLTARHVYLGAGSAGTTRILLRSEQAGLDLSRHLGARVSANGDVLGAIYNTPRFVGPMPWRDTRGAGREPAVGQTISLFADLRARDVPLAEQFVLLDGVIPRPFVPAAARALGLHPSVVAGALGSPEAALRLARDAMPALYPPSDGALAHTMIVLACGHDSSGGRYVLEDGAFYVRWPGVRGEPSFEAIHRVMEACARELGGVFVENPRSALGGVMQATHPLGGAPMGETVDEGVVDHCGRVFDPRGGLHEGLHVLDAAAIPRSLAAPPLATISALAERAMRLAGGAP